MFVGLCFGCTFSSICSYSTSRLCLQLDFLLPSCSMNLLHQKFQAWHELRFVSQDRVLNLNICFQRQAQLSLSALCPQGVNLEHFHGTPRGQCSPVSSTQHPAPGLSSTEQVTLPFLAPLGHSHPSGIKPGGSILVTINYLYPFSPLCKVFSRIQLCSLFTD